MHNEVQLIPEYAEIKFITEHEGTKGQMYVEFIFCYEMAGPY